MLPPLEPQIYPRMEHIKELLFRLYLGIAVRPNTLEREDLGKPPTVFHPLASAMAECGFNVGFDERGRRPRTHRARFTFRDLHDNVKVDVCFGQIEADILV